MKQDPINTGSYTLGLLVANTKNMVDTQAQNNLIVGNYLKDGYNKLANAYALNLQQEQLEKQNAFKQESLNLQKQQITNQVQQWWDTKQQWAEQKKLERQKMQESARVANLQFDLANRQLAYQKERDKPSIGLQQHQLDSLTRLSTDPLLQVPTTQDFGVTGRSGGSARNAEVNFGIVGRSVAGANTAGFGAAANTAPIAGGFYTKYMQSQMPQKDSTSNGGLNITGKDVLTAALGQDKLTQAAKVGGFYTKYMQSQMPQKDSTNAVSLAAQMPKDDLAKYFIPASKAKPQQINTQEFLIPTYQAVLIKLDNDMPLSAQDKYVANLMGVKYNDKDFNVKTTEMSKNMQELKNNLSLLEATAGLKADGKELAGVINNLVRWGFQATGGLYDINPKSSEFIQKEEIVKRWLINLMVRRGNSSKNPEKDAESALSRNKSPKMQISSLQGVDKMAIEDSEEILRALKNKGAKEEVISDYRKQLDKFIKGYEYLDGVLQADQPIDYEKYINIVGISRPTKQANSKHEIVFVK
ncbi:hypothetical protein [Helicobacter mesocricetorum]|uniref:hypothetical protein n=1 Tax=Helicobacter mesocricetorum TaxID=87012 RepID=UPI000CF1056D|nr:hypothetical protein [Helicobacter mesocricetorum]